MKYKYLFNVLLFLALLISESCNFEEQCKNRTPNDNYEVCLFLLQNYNSADESRKQNIRSDLISTNCLMTYQDIGKCKKESTRWPLPD